MIALSRSTERAGRAATITLSGSDVLRVGNDRVARHPHVFRQERDGRCGVEVELMCCVCFHGMQIGCGVCVLLSPILESIVDWSVSIPTARISAVNLSPLRKYRSS